MANCKKCGAELKPNAKFCDVCGAPVDIEGAAQDAYGQAAGNAQNTYQQAAGNAQNSYQQAAGGAQNSYQQGGYAQPNSYAQPQKTPGNDIESAGTVGSWVLAIFLTCIPIVGLVMLFVWSFSSDTPLGKKNWAKAQLIWMLIGIAISIIITIVMVTAGLSFYSVAHNSGRLY